jgi:hypothetical protein
MTDTTIASVAEQEAARIRRRGIRQAVELLVMGESDLAHQILRASFLEQVYVLDLEPAGWTNA